MNKDTSEKITWVTVLLIFVLPIAFCEYQDDVADHKARTVCIEQMGECRIHYGGTCKFTKD